MVQPPPTTLRELEEDDDYGPPVTDESDECEDIVQRTGEVCGRDRPCRFHD